jgi:hypothetical protein
MVAASMLPNFFNKGDELESNLDSVVVGSLAEWLPEPGSLSRELGVDSIDEAPVTVEIKVHETVPGRLVGVGN